MISGTVPAMLIQIKSMQVPHLKFVNKIQQVLLIFFAEIGIFGKGTEQTGSCSLEKQLIGGQTYDEKESGIYYDEE